MSRRWVGFWILVGIGASVAPAADTAFATNLPSAAAQQAGAVETIAGPIDAGSGGIEVDAAGNVYTADFGVHLSQGPAGTRVWRVAPDGDTSVFAEGLVAASGNTFDDRGNLLQANIGGNTISRIDPDGRVTTFAEGFRNPVGIALGSDGSLFVANCGDDNIARVGPEGGVEVVAADSLLRCPNGLTMGPGGELYVSNFYNGDVLRIGGSGDVEVLATLPGDNNGHLTYGNGRLYVVARGAHQIFEVTLDGQATLLVGSGERGLDDGPAEQATLSFPNDVALGPCGRHLYWNDVGLDSPDSRVLTPTYVRRVALPESRHYRP